MQLAIVIVLLFLILVAAGRGVAVLRRIERHLCRPAIDRRGVAWEVGTPEKEA